MENEVDEMLHLENVKEYLEGEIKRETAAHVELVLAASDFAKLVMVEHFPTYDIAVQAAYERLRLAIGQPR